jgi:tRNA (guanine37-N1)-methyltransferase
MKFDIITIFPSLFDSFLKESLIEKAICKKHIQVNVHDLRNWTEDKHQTVDEKPFGGGSGMVMKVEPIYKAVKELKKEGRVILFTPRGRKFNQKKAYEFAQYNQVVMICGRYEGVDERVAKHIADEEVSLGDYVLMGGELPAMIVTEVVSRLVPKVVGKDNFLKERKKPEGFLEYPQYTRPETFLINGKERKVPKILLSGDHKKIEEWKSKKGKIIK